MVVINGAYQRLHLFRLCDRCEIPLHCWREGATQAAVISSSTWSSATANLKIWPHTCMTRRGDSTAPRASIFCTAASTSQGLILPRDFLPNTEKTFLSSQTLTLSCVLVNDGRDFQRPLVDYRRKKVCTAAAVRVLRSSRLAWLGSIPSASNLRGFVAPLARGGKLYIRINAKRSVLRLPRSR